MKHAISRAMPVAEVIRSHLEPGCSRIEIAGSLRRREATVSDIELVCVPKTRRDLFGEPSEDDELSPVLVELLRAGRLAYRGTQTARGVTVAPGAKYLSLVAVRAQIPVDLFIVRPPAQWGAILAIRTGPADYSRMLVTLARDAGLRCTGGHLEDANGNTIATPEEEDFVRRCGVTPLPPEERGRYVAKLGIPADASFGPPMDEYDRHG